MRQAIYLWRNGVGCVLFKIVVKINDHGFDSARDGVVETADKLVICAAYVTRTIYRGVLPLKGSKEEIPPTNSELGGTNENNILQIMP